MLALYRGCGLMKLMRWADVDLEKAPFDLTGKDSETKHRGILPLSGQTMKILNRRQMSQKRTQFMSSLQYQSRPEASEFSITTPLLLPPL